MTKEEHYCDNINCNHNDTKGLCCLFNPENCKYRQLQKENAELRAIAENQQSSNMERYFKNKDMEKENAELKTKYESVSIVAHNRGQFALSAMRENREYETKLTKAKEIIKTFLGFAEAFGYSPSMDKFIADTEQFLNSEVKK